MRSAAEVVAEIVPDDFIETQAGRLKGTMQAIRHDIGFAVAQAREDGARWMQGQIKTLCDGVELRDGDRLIDDEDVQAIDPAEVRKVAP